MKNLRRVKVVNKHIGNGKQVGQRFFFLNAENTLIVTKFTLFRSFGFETSNYNPSDSNYDNRGIGVNTANAKRSNDLYYCIESQSSFLFLRFLPQVVTLGFKRNSVMPFTLRSLT